MIDFRVFIAQNTLYDGHLENMNRLLEIFQKQFKTLNIP